MSDKGHLLPFTAWYVVLRGTQLCLAIVIMGLAGYGINYYPFSGGFDGVNLNMYTVSPRYHAQLPASTKSLAGHRNYHYGSLHPRRNLRLTYCLQLLGHTGS